MILPPCLCSVRRIPLQSAGGDCPTRDRDCCEAGSGKSGSVLLCCFSPYLCNPKVRPPLAADKPTIIAACVAASMTSMKRPSGEISQGPTEGLSKTERRR